MLSGVEKRTLPNGLTVLIQPDRRVPLACVLTWVRVGYFNEPDSLTGVSHFIEHLFFKGTSRRGVGEIANETKALGGYLNAATIYDHTYYYTVVPSQSVKQAIDIQADALMHPLFDAAEMEKEKEVIVQELKRKYDNPNPYAWEKLLEMAFEHHRIRRWRMGREEEIRRYPREEVIAHYKRYYQPGNVRMAIVGDFDSNEVWHEVEKLYGEMPTTKIERDESPSEPPQKSAKLARLTGDVSQAIVKMGFHAPSMAHADYHAMTFLSILLGRGRSSRLHRSLKEEKRVVDAIGASLYSSADVGYFTLEAELQPEKIPLCEEEICLELERLRRDPPTADEVMKIRNIVEANFFAERQDVMGQAYSLAYFEDLGGYEKAIEYVEKMRAVTPADVLRVAQTYCTFSNMSLMEYVPKTVGEGAAPDLRLDSLQKRVTSLVEGLGPISTPSTVPAVGPFVLSKRESKPLAQGMEAISLDGGVTLLHLEAKTLPLVSVGVYFPGGRLDETDENCGITSFLLRNTLKGTEGRTADEVAFEMERMGSSIQVDSTADHFGYSMNLLSRNLEKGMDLLSDVMTRPTFSTPEIEKERSTALAGLKRIRDDMFVYPIELFYRSLYGHHPYGLPRQGTEASLTSLGRTQMLDWYTQTFCWRRMVVAIVGDVDRARAMEVVKKRFAVSGDLDPETRAQIIPIGSARGVREKVEERERHQTGIVMGFNGVSIRDDRYFALEVLRNILSGMGGRLYVELREKRSLAYTVTAFNIGLMRGGAFFMYIACDPDREGEVRNRLLVELARARTKSCDDAEIRAAKAYSRGSHAIALQSNGAVAYTYLTHYLSGRGLDAIAEYERRIDAVNAEQIRRVAEEILDTENCALGIVRGKRA